MGLIKYHYECPICGGEIGFCRGCGKELGAGYLCTEIKFKSGDERVRHYCSEKCRNNDFQHLEEAVGEIDHAVTDHDVFPEKVHEET